MSNELVKTNDKSISTITDTMIDDFLFGSDTKLNDNQKKLFKGIAQASNLNPFKKEIYAVPYEINVLKNNVWTKETKLSIVTGYQVYLERAAATGKLNGWKVEMQDTGALITIYRKDFDYPVEWFVEKSEFLKKNKDGKPMGSWATMPNFMLRKIAIGQGMRIAFPEALNGLPYLQEEQQDMEDFALEERQEETKKNVGTVKVSKVVDKKEKVVIADAEFEIVEEQTNIETVVKPVVSELVEEEVEIEVIEPKKEEFVPTEDNYVNPALTKYLPKKEVSPEMSKVKESIAEDNKNAVAKEGVEKLTFDALIRGIGSGDSEVLKHISEHFDIYSKSTQVMINESLNNAGRNPIDLVKKPVEEEKPFEPKIIPVKKEEIKVEDAIDIFDEPEEVPESKESILKNQIIENFKEIVKLTKSVHPYEQMMKTNIFNKFGKTLDELTEDNMNQLNAALIKKIDTLK